MTMAALSYFRPSLTPCTTLPLSIPLSLPACASLSPGADLLVKASSGTGRTMAYMIPCLDQLVSSLSDSPTRLLAGAGTPVEVSLMVVGGMSMDGEGRRLQQAPCQVLVATPARLLEHLQETHGMRNRMQQLKLFVLEDLDRMVEMGFTRTIHAILSLLPPTRQTLLFSNALSSEVQDLSQLILKADYVSVDLESA
ncbi:unnamed protein product [Closterium sp. Yama58-4]|nr:unnamed protein product [Closterium sp. Yama58-4]